MDKRVYGVIGISSIMSNWNADFSGHPKSITNGDVYGSDKALKYPMKKMWENEGEKVLYIKSMTFIEDNKLAPRTLKERYEEIFGIEDLKKVSDMKEILTNLFKAIDVKNFGATFAEGGTNISITGAVQFTQGFNKYAASETQEQPILSPFRDPKAKEKSAKKSEDGSGEEAKSSTLGSKITSDEAHYFYSFSVNPYAYKQFTELGVTEGYTEEDYKKFKETALISATAFDTNSKAGCDNEFGMFVETEDDLYLPNLANYIEFTKGADGEKNKIKLICGDMINELMDKIKSVQIYYNPYTTDLEQDIKGVKLYNIFTLKEV